MGKASSAKKVARAARAGGTSRSGRRRNLGFPLTVVAVVVLGVTLILVARNDQQASAEPVVNVDHWHAAYGIYACDKFLPAITDQTDKVGIHTHGDGVIHIHPFVSGAAGANATMGVFFDAVGLQVNKNEISIPGGETFLPSEQKCNNEAAIVQIARWANAADAAAGEKPTEIITDDFDKIRFRADREAYTIAFLPEGADIPPPESIPTLDTLSDVAGASSTSSSTVPGQTTTTVPGGTTSSSSTTPTTAPSSTSSTSAP